jgi:predicted O-methyltransferase YrrM
LVDAATDLKQAVDGLRRACRRDYLPRGLLARAALNTHTTAASDAAATSMKPSPSPPALAEGAPTAARDHLTRAHNIITEPATTAETKSLPRSKPTAAERVRSLHHELHSLPRVTTRLPVP